MTRTKQDNARIKCIQPECRDELMGMTVYHYTSPEAFRAMIQKKKLRFTDIRFLNDKSESRYFVEMLAKFLGRNRGRYVSIESSFYRMLNGRNPREISNVYDESFVVGDEEDGLGTPPRCFVFCTCTGHDCLNMWNYYVNNNAYQGYNIGFRVEGLLNSFLQNQDILLPRGLTVKYGRVVYQEEAQFRLLEMLARDVERKIARLEMYHENEDDMAIWNQWLIQREIDAYAAFFKHPSFEAEHEFRIALIADLDQIPFKTLADKYSGESNDQLMEGFCTKKGLIVPYLQMGLPADAIASVTVAPIMEFEIASRGVRELMHGCGVDGVDILQSDIPIRF